MANGRIAKVRLLVVGYIQGELERIWKRSLSGQPTSFRYLHIDQERLGPESIQAFFPQGVGLGDFSTGLQPLLR